jgi:glutathione S-transferase
VDRHLANHSLFIDDAYTIADIALCAYPHVADEGGFDLSPDPKITAWQYRVAIQ